MGDIVNIKDHLDFKSCTYFGENNKIGVALRGGGLSVAPMDAPYFMVTMMGKDNYFIERSELAEFINVLSVMIDPDKKWMPSGELAAMHY